MEELKNRVASLIQKSKGDRKIIESLEKEEKAPPFSREKRPENLAPSIETRRQEPRTAWYMKARFS